MLCYVMFALCPLPSPPPKKKMLSCGVTFVAYSNERLLSFFDYSLYNTINFFLNFTGVLLCIADAFASARASLDLGLKVTECRLDR